jgi:hypothetical protein
VTTFGTGTFGSGTFGNPSGGGAALTATINDTAAVADALAVASSPLLAPGPLMELPAAARAASKRLVSGTAAASTARR